MLEDAKGQHRGRRMNACVKSAAFYLDGSFVANHQNWGFAITLSGGVVHRSAASRCSLDREGL